LTVEEKKIAVIEVERGHNKPYAVNEVANIDGRKAKIKLYYNRHGSTTREITDRDEIQRLFQASGKLHYEITPVAGATISDLDATALAEYLQNFRRLEVSTFDEPALHRLMENLNLLTRTDTGLRPTVAGLLLFGKNRVTRWLPQNGVDCVKIRGRDLGQGTEDVKFFERQVFANLEDALAFIYRYNTHSFVIEGVRRVDQFDYPEKALRECLVNALVHRDYTISGSHVRVHLFEDRIEVPQPGPHSQFAHAGQNQARHDLSSQPGAHAVFLCRASFRTSRPRHSNDFSRDERERRPEPVFEDLGEKLKITLYKRAGDSRHETA